MIGCYSTLLNLPPYLRSEVKNIKLIFLCKEKDQRKYGWKELLRVLIDDLKKMESVGITVDTDEGPIHFKCGFVAVFGDNLGSHGIGGYAEAFTALVNFICRYCDMPFDEFLKEPTKIKPLRTIEEYAVCASEAMETNKIVRGIKVNSPLNDLGVYKVSKPGLPPCIDHDIYEGFAPHDLWLCIESLVKEKCFDIDVLNFRLNDFQFESEAQKSIPKVNLKRVKGKPGKFSETASQMKRIVMILPLVLADLMKESISPAISNVWDMMILLKKICSTVSAPSLSHGQLILFRDDSKKYLELRVHCFPKVKLRPKHKFFMHYFDLIIWFGTLKFSSMIRFEAKHFYFQSATKHQKNYKNLTQSLAEKHERLQSINDNYCDVICEPTQIAKFVSDDYQPQISSQVMQYATALEMNDVNVSQLITFRGVTHEKGMIVCVGKSIYGNYLICNIELIILNNDRTDISFVGNTEEIVLSEELGVYKIVKYEEQEKSCSTLSVFPYSSLLSAEPLLQTTIKTVPVLQAKYVPFDPDL
ncbi:hypothetical protein QAD02_014024 [Eretmocerus hayati]|uniref:Uncharacterized protein n=1 Tax=Eretmocerus hayati TaxID=131215 RepID=A0ACC2P6Z6_9HYME|nr:hypothetical protein QAD02_014024 [Eretmocerus hayati]